MSGLAIEYGTHDRVREIVDRLTYCAEHVSVAFDGWDEPHVKGPGSTSRSSPTAATARTPTQWATTGGPERAVPRCSTRTRSSTPSRR